VNDDHTLATIKDRLAKARDSLGEAQPGIPVGEIIARARSRRARRRVIPGMAGVGALAAGAAVAVTVLLPASHPASHQPRARAAARPATTGPALATGYVVRRVQDAVANDGQVMREVRSLDDPSQGGSGFWDGQQSYEQVTWTYQGRNNIEVFGAHGRLQGTEGTGIVNGKLQGVEVDYILHQWSLQSGNFYSSPVNACTNAGFLDSPNDPGTNWPLVIVRTLACGGYKMAGYADINGAETVKITGSRVLGAGSSGESTNTVTLFVSPLTYLPVRITLSIASPGLHTSLTSFGIQWLPPTAANRARASVTVPCGFQQVSSSSGKPISGQPRSACG
jgi:hypothetical protein